MVSFYKMKGLGKPFLSIFSCFWAFRGTANLWWRCFFGENLGSTKCYCFSGPGGLDWALPFCIKVNSWCPTILSRKAGVRPLGANSNGDKLVFRNMSFETCLSQCSFPFRSLSFEACLSKHVFRNVLSHTFERCQYIRKKAFRLVNNWY